MYDDGRMPLPDYFSELAILARAIAHRNLSAASMHVGISQPHLSRTVQKLERGLNLKLLDRASKRRSAWTPEAYRLAEAYARNIQRFSRDLIGLGEEREVESVRIGSLEGLVPLALRIAHGLLGQPRMRLVELEVHDLTRLEQMFGQGDLDLVLTSREPGRRKFRHVEVLGFQSLARTGQRKGALVMSPFEHDTLRGPPAGPKVFVCNSLEVRKQWVARHGGSAVLPSEVRARAGQGESVRVLLIGDDELAPALWRESIRLARA
jgi:DNA-binding transcriptional LysR family regulator